jgi:hypothetical protein
MNRLFVNGAGGFGRGSTFCRAAPRPGEAAAAASRFAGIRGGDAAILPASG